MELHCDSDIAYFVDGDNSCQLRCNNGKYISDDKLFEVFTKVDGQISSI
jgi:hypothetical protein